MINDMDYHTKAWMDILNNELGASLTWEETKKEMYGKNQEVLVRVFGPDRFTATEMDEISIEKERRYQQAYLPHLSLLPGLHELLERAWQKGIPMAIGSAAIPFNINFVLDNLNIGHYFKTIVSADDVTFSKPDPETYFKVAIGLQVNPTNCLVFEDVPKGAEAAFNAGMECVILTTTHQPEEFKNTSNIRHFAPDFTDDFFKQLF